MPFTLCQLLLREAIKDRWRSALTDSTSHERRKRSSSATSTSGTTIGLSLPVEESVGHVLEEVIHALHYLSIAILSLLVLEAVVKIAAHGTHIFKNKMEVSMFSWKEAGSNEQGLSGLTSCYRGLHLLEFELLGSCSLN